MLINKAGMLDSNYTKYSFLFIIVNYLEERKKLIHETKVKQNKEFK